MVTIRGLDNEQKPALVMRECQERMVGEASAAAGSGLAQHAQARGMVDSTATLAASFRRARLPVVHCTFHPRLDYLGTSINCLLFGNLQKRRPREPGGRREDNPIHPKLGPEPDDFVLARLHGLEAFHDTELDSVLRNQGVRTVVLCGVSTNLGIPGTALGAVNRGYAVVIPEDCTAGAWPEAHEFQVQHTLNLLATVTTSREVGAVIDALAGVDA